MYVFELLKISWIRISQEKIKRNKPVPEVKTELIFVFNNFNCFKINKILLKTFSVHLLTPPPPPPTPP